MSGAGSSSGNGPRPGLRLRKLTEETAGGQGEPEPGRMDAVRRGAARLGRVAWAHLRPTRNRTTGYVAVGAIGALIGTSVVVGVGASGSLPQLADIGAWLGSAQKGEVAHADGLTGDVDGKVTLPGMTGHPVQISQDGKSVLVLDAATGRVVRIDPAQLTAQESSDYGASGLQIVAGGALSYLVDPAHGTVQRIDPVRTTPIGEKVSLGARLGTAQVDPDGTLWVPVPGRGQVVPVTAGRRGAAVDAGRPGDALLLTLAAGRPVVTDTTTSVTRLLSATGALSSFNLGGMSGAGILVPARTDGHVVPVLATGTGSLTLIDTQAGQQSSIRVPIEGHRLGAPQTLGVRIYIPDQTTGSLLVYNTDTSAFENAVRVTGRPGTLDVFVRDGLLWANDQRNAAAAVVNASGTARRFGKYATDVPSARKPREHNPVVAHVPTAPATAPAPPRHSAPPPARRPSGTPTVNCGINWQAGCPQPLAPGTPQVESGDGSITVTFAAASGTTPKSYTLGGDVAGLTVAPKSVGPKGPFTFQVTGGSCSKTYTFTVVAHYSGGAGDKASQSSVAARPCVAPPNPTVTVTIPQGGHGADWKWNAVGPQSTTSYSLLFRGGTSGGTGTDDSVDQVPNGTTYPWTLTTTNPAGSATQSGTIDLRPPSKRLSDTDNSNNGDPLYIRTQPSTTSGTRDGNIPAGNNSTMLTVECQVTGSQVTNDNGDYTSAIWDRISWNGHTDYISDLWVSTANHRTGQYSPQDVWQCT